MTAPTRSLPSLVAALTIAALALLGCSSSPAAAPSSSVPAPAPMSASPAMPASTDAETAAPTASGAVPTSEPGSSEPSTGEPSTAEPSTAEPSTAEPSTAEPSTGEPSTAEPSTGEPSDTAGSGSTGGPARIEVSGAICDFLEKKIPVSEMATLSGQAVDRTVEMGDDWCIYGASNPGNIVTVQYQEDAKGDFDLLGADGTPVDTSTLGVPMYANQDLNEVYFLDGTTQWTVTIGSSTDGADPAK